MSQSAPFAYLFERFPSFVQTFVYREAAEMVRQKMAPWLVSIRRPEDTGALAEGIDLPVFYLPNSDELRADLDAREAVGQIPARLWRPILEGRNKADSTRVFEALWLGAELKKRRIRHVHAHFGGLATRTAWLIKKLFGISYSFTGHANDIFCETDLPITNEMLVREATLIVTETDFARYWMEQKYPFALGRIARVFNGMAIDGFPALRPPGTIPRIVSVGRYVEKKGFEDLIAACRLLKARGCIFECLIIGGGPLEEALRACIERSDLTDTVKLLGPLPQSEVRQLLSTAQVFALASVPEEGGGSDNLPTVIIEAMLAGLPVVSTRVAGIPEIIDEGVNGFLVEAKDAASLAEKLETLLHDQALAARFGVAGRVAAADKFAVERTASMLKHFLVERCGILPPKGAREVDPSLPSTGLWQKLFR